jgi:hypothetical protein
MRVRGPWTLVATTATGLLFMGCSGEVANDAGADVRRSDVVEDVSALDSLAQDDGLADAGDALSSDVNVSDVGGDRTVAHDVVDAGMGVVVPSEIAAEVVFESSAGAATPPTWNAHLPKLVGDDRFFYAVYTHAADAVSSRYAAVLRRARSGGAWTEVARFQNIHQPPGVVMTRAGALHVTFGCLRSSPGVDATCFAGGAGTNGLNNRYYRFVFSARDASGALRWDTYANYSEWTAESNGYAGIAVAPNDDVQWSLLDAAYNRVVFRSSGAAGSTVATLSEAGRALLYPLSAWDGARALLFAGEFDRSGGSNAGYPASSLFSLGAGGAARVLRVVPEVPVGAGMIGAFPSDLEVTRDGTIYALAYQRRAGSVCTALFRSDGGDRFDSVPVRCFDTYARLQLVDDGTLVLVATGTGARVHVGVSTNRGDSWSWSDVAVRGTHPADVSIYGYTLIDPRSSPGIFQSNQVHMVFSGSDSGGLARRLYYAHWSLR